MTVSAVVILGFCVGRVLVKALPWLYQASAVGIWIAMDVLFTIFFSQEISFIIETGKEGKMYGTIV